MDMEICSEYSMLTHDHHDMQKSGLGIEKVTWATKYMPTGIRFL